MFILKDSDPQATEPRRVRVRSREGSVTKERCGAGSNQVLKPKSYSRDLKSGQFRTLNGPNQLGHVVKWSVCQMGSEIRTKMLRFQMVIVGI